MDWRDMIIWRSLTAGRLLKILQSGFVHFCTSALPGALALVWMQTIYRKLASFGLGSIPRWAVDLCTFCLRGAQVGLVCFVAWLVHCWLDGLLGPNVTQWLMLR